MATSRRNALITGAGSGIGRAIALELAKDHWHVLIADLNLAGAEETKTLVEQAGGTAEVEKLDVRSEEAWLALRDRLQKEWTQLDMLVNNAGVCATGEIGDMSLADFRWVVDINLMGVVLGCHVMVPWMKGNKNRSYIMNMSSISGIMPPPALGAYATCKAGVIALTETLFLELKNHNVGATVVCPWFAKTNLLNDGRFVRETEKASAAYYMATSSVSPERVAREGLRATFRGKICKVVGRRATMMAYTKSVARQFYMQLMHFTLNSGIVTAAPHAAKPLPQTEPEKKV